MPDVAQTIIELSLEWGRANADLFVSRVAYIQTEYPTAQWGHHIDLSRKGFLRITATRREPVALPSAADVNWSLVANAVSGARESGCSPWLGDFAPVDQVSFDLRQGFRLRGDVWYAQPHYYASGGKIAFWFDGPHDDEGTYTTQMTLGSEEFVRGLSLMQANSPRHYADIVSGNDDAETHDVFMQYVLLGDVIYG